MYKIILIIVTNFLLFSCKAQESNSQINKDLIIIDNLEKDIKSTIKTIQSNDKLILIFDKQIIPKPKQIILYKENTTDTMKISCYCNYNENIYLQNLRFTKGNYKLNLIQELRNNKGQNIKMNNQNFKKIDIQNLLK